MVEDQRDCEIANYYVALLLQHKKYSSPFEYPYFFERVFRKTLLDYIVAKAPTSPRNLTRFTRPFLLVRGWGLGTRLDDVSRLINHVLPPLICMCTTFLYVNNKKYTNQAVNHLEKKHVNKKKTRQVANKDALKPQINVYWAEI